MKRHLFQDCQRQSEIKKILAHGAKKLTEIEGKIRHKFPLFLVVKVEILLQTHSEKKT